MGPASLWEVGPFAFMGVEVALTALAIAMTSGSQPAADCRTRVSLDAVLNLIAALQGRRALSFWQPNSKMRPILAPNVR